MKIQIDPTGHRVFPEINSPEIDYHYFCPVCDENYFDTEVQEVECDPTEVYHVESSNGDLYLDIEGNVLRQETKSDCRPVVWFDLNEYKEIWNVDTIPPDIDILDIRGIFNDGTELVWSHYKARRNVVTNPREFIEMVNGWCNDYMAGDDHALDAVGLVGVIQTRTQEWLDIIK